MKKALLMIDLQNDFMPGGALAVPNGDQVIPIANKLQDYFEIIIATQDWHPAYHSSFAVNHPEQIGWPMHCVQNTKGAAFVDGLNMSQINHIVQKGIDVDIDSYSGFFDNLHQKATSLENYLRSLKITDLYILGVATDYCVKFTVMDACHLGFKTFLIVDACRGINMHEGDVEKAIEEMQTAGAIIINSNSLIRGA